MAELVVEAFYDVFCGEAMEFMRVVKNI